MASLRRTETASLVVVQRVLARAPVIAGARGMSRVGEHALGWLAVGAVAMVRSSGERRKDWSRALASVFLAHASAVVIKRLVRRPRPDDPRIRVLVGTPSRLSFPSAHVSSTTAAAITYGHLLGSGRSGPASVIALMGTSRLVLGVHFPSDVAVGALTGWAVAVTLHRPRT